MANSDVSGKNPDYWRPEDERSDTEKFVSKLKRDPFIPIGLTGFFAAVVYGAYAYKNRGPSLTTSRYLMRLRLIAQGTCVGAIILGLGVKTFNKSKGNE